MLPARRNQSNWLPSIFNDFLGSEWLEHRNTTAPAVNILETDTEYRVEVAAPGMTRDDFKVHINEDNELMISLEKRTEQKEEEKDKCKKKCTYLRREFSYTQFRQSLLLPDNIERDKISACVENGMMTIEIPKKSVATTTVARQIEVK